jgi:multimeric flavodoxin WrbA
MTPRRIFALSTTTHAVDKSTSVAMLDTCTLTLHAMYPDAEIRSINANELHIVENLSCYANGKKNCADPASGPYRCWANYLSNKNPEEYGGRDQMSVIYDGLMWADTVLFATSVRWGSHSALAQKIIERMDTLENRAVAYGEPYPLHGKRLGVIVAGLHWKTESTAAHLLDVFRWFGFRVPPGMDGALWWQRSKDPYFEHVDADQKYVLRWLGTPNGEAAVMEFLQSVLA